MLPILTASGPARSTPTKTCADSSVRSLAEVTSSTRISTRSTAPARAVIRSLPTTADRSSTFPTSVRVCPDVRMGLSSPGSSDFMALPPTRTPHSAIHADEIGYALTS
ncbi:MAG: hypothetical protein ACJ8DI_11965 [Ktedonobacteraceae bacterium]